MSSGRQPFPHLDSNQDKGFQRPVCCHYTMGESWAFGPQVFIYIILSVFTERLRHVASRIVCFPRTNTHVIRRTGSLDRDARGRCRTVRRPTRLRTRRGWRWPAAGRSTGRSSHPSASSGIGTVSVSTTSRAPQFLSRSMAGPESTPCVATTVTDLAPASCSTWHAPAMVPAVSIRSSTSTQSLPATSPTTRLATAWFGRVMSRVLCTKARGPPPRRCAHCSATRMRPASGRRRRRCRDGPGNDHGCSRPAPAWPPDDRPGRRRSLGTARHADRPT